MIAVITGLILCGCSESLQNRKLSTPIPKHIVDLGTQITEDTLEDFWGKGFLHKMGFEESNSFDAITWKSGPMSGSNSYFRLFNHGGPHVDAPNHVGRGRRWRYSWYERLVSKLSDARYSVQLCCAEFLNGGTYTGNALHFR